MYFFTADEHYGHTNIIEYSSRPFKNIKDMDVELIKRHNAVVSKNDIVIHAGDFTLRKNKRIAYNYIKLLNGNNIFLQGSHDYWLPIGNQIWQKFIDDTYVVVCHYSMRTWARSHYNSWQLFGHSHGKLEPVGKQWDIGVDNNNYYPVSFSSLKAIMHDRPDNFNLVKNRRG